MSGGVRHTRERLAEAAERCASLDEVVACFGTRPYGKVRRYRARRFAHFGIDISHFARSGGHARPGPDELCRAVTESASVAETLRRLGRPDNGTQRALRRTWIAEDRLSTEHFLGQAHQRGRRRPDRVRRPEGILVQHEGRRRTAPVCSAAHSTRCGAGGVRRVRPRARVAAKADDAGGRPHQRRLERRPSRQPSPAVPQLPRDDDHLVPRRPATAYSRPVKWGATGARTPIGREAGLRSLMLSVQVRPGAQAERVRHL